METSNKKYLFFDIECSNCFQNKGKMCEFGYVLTDEHFNILKEDVYQMSPGSGRENRFDLGVYKRDPEFDWAWDIQSYFDCEEFPYYYQRIKEIIEDENTIVFGFAITNDIDYLAYTCERYNLSLFNYKCIDIQVIIDRFLPNIKRRLGLQKAFKELFGDKAILNYRGHLSRDDAKMTKDIAKYVADFLETDIENIGKILCPKSIYDAIPTYKDGKAIRKRKACPENRAFWKNTVANFENSHINEPEYVNVTEYVIKYKNKLLQVYDQIKKLGLVPKFGVDNVKFLICYNDEDIEFMKSKIKGIDDSIFITINDFLKLEA